MNVVADTHIVLWDALSNSKLSSKAQKVLDRAEQGGRLWIANITIWEICMLVKRGRVHLPVPTAQFIDLVIASRGYQIQPLNAQIAEEAVNFGTEINNDPADRLIVATARHLNAQLLSVDQNLHACGLVTVIN